MKTALILLLTIYLMPLQAVTLEEAIKIGGSDFGYPLFNALNKSGKNEQELTKALKTATAEHKDAVRFLISFMPERDLRDLSAEYILQNVALAFEARNKFPWAKQVPLKVFYNDVLPYAFLNERRDSWRKDFFKRFAPMVKDCKTIEEAAIIINKKVKEELGVIYSKKRPKADQSPYESMDCKLASCTGLSVLLGAALRSVGIPSRIAGVPEWTLMRGNHNWNEVWIDGEWKFTEYYFDGLNKGWFLKHAAGANDKLWNKKVYATSFTPTQYWFPCVWDFNIRYVHAVDVSASYKKLYKDKVESDKKGYRTTFVFYKENTERQAIEIKIKNSEGKIVAEGKTKGPEEDLNNKLELNLSPGGYEAVYSIDGKALTKKFKIQDLLVNEIILKSE